MIRIKRSPKPSEWFSIHSHSKFSAADALPEVKDMVKRAKELGYKGLGLTDHGNIAGSVQLYTECMKEGIKPFPGSELYVVRDREDTKAKRFHMCVVAFSEEGYRNLIHLSTLTHRNFHYKPLIDLADLARLSDEGRLKGLAVTTGCFFGLVIQTLIQEGYDAAKQTVAALASWFDACYVELQFHNIEQEPMSERQLADNLVSIAKDLGLKCVSTQDCHYVMAEDKAAHESMKRLVTWSDDPGEALFPGDGFHMADDAWMKEHHSDLYELGLEGLDDLIERHTLTIPELDLYTPRIPGRHADPAAVLRERCEAALGELGLTRSYYDRLDSELDTIHFNGMEGYILLVAEVTDYCREHGIFFQARGSAAGSLVCWLMGITPVDPLKWGLLMERFLAKDRKKMPDIDLDIQSARRQELVDYLSLNYSISQIGTWGKMTISKEEEGKGSIWVKVFSRLRKEGREAKMESLTEDEWEELKVLSGFAPYAQVGKHAGGLIMMSTREELNQMVPQMWIASSKTMVSQYDMKDVEKLGLVKLDALGLHTMDVLEQAIINMGRDPRDGMDFIPLRDGKTYSMISKGDTDGVFQLEGGAMRRGVRELKPKNIEDVIASMALYRPATMNNGSTEQFVERRHRRDEVPVRHEIINRITAKTQGILVYQEQMIQILRELGMGADELTKVLKAIKASNGNVGDATGVLNEMLEGIKDLARDAGMDEHDLHFLESSLLGYAEYGFNRSHAVVYGITAYQCAYLAQNFPVEFHAALLSVASGTEKEPKYVAATRRRGIRVARPEINASGVGYTPDKNKVVRGLLSIDGIGEKAARNLVENQPYRNLRQLAESVDTRIVSGTNDLKKLIKQADKDGSDLDELVNAHQFPGVIGALKKAHSLRSILKEDL